MEQSRLEQAYQEFGKAKTDSGEDMGREFRLYSYAACGAPRDSEFRVPLVWTQIESDLRGLINNVNGWLGRLRAWRAWNQVLPSYNEQDQWSLRIEFLEDVTFYSMMQPSGFLDRSLEAVTFLLHHASLSLNTGCRDEFPNDKKIYKRIEKNHPAPYDCFMSRKEKRDHVQSLSEGWVCATELLQQLDSMNDSEHQELTMDFRNRASHSFAPRLELGVVPTVTRRPIFSSNMVQRPDGRYDAVQDRTKPSISYGYGEMSPLSSTDSFRENQRQWQIARKVLDAYGALIAEVDQKLRARSNGITDRDENQGEQA